MPLFKELELRDSVKIHTTPAKVFAYLTGLVDDESYREWHPGDHVAMRWLEGRPWQEGSVVYAEEMIHGKLHKLKFVVTKVVPGRFIEYVPTSQTDSVLIVDLVL